MKILLLILLLSGNSLAFGQSQKTGIYRVAELLFESSASSENPADGIHLPFRFPVNFELKYKPSIIKSVFFSPPVYCEKDLAFFCRIEAKMEKALRTPVRFRLGSASYVDWLEGKSAARFMDFAR